MQKYKTNKKITFLQKNGQQQVMSTIKHIVLREPNNEYKFLTKILDDWAEFLHKRNSSNTSNRGENSLNAAVGDGEVKRICDEIITFKKIFTSFGDAFRVSKIEVGMAVFRVLRYFVYNEANDEFKAIVSLLEHGKDISMFLLVCRLFPKMFNH